MPQVLLIEDDLDEAKKIRAALQERNMEVTWIVGVRAMPDANGVALGLAIGELSFIETPILFSEFDGVLLDTDLRGQYDGFQIIPELLKAGVKVCGISSTSGRNAALESLGAVTSCFKSQVVSELDKILSKLL